jgi:uncharacterized membrane protein YobD (UPF0266 family)
MSRKWERMVRKNTKTVNKSRLKQGISPVSDPDQPQVYKGRSTVLSLFLVAVSLFLVFTLKDTEQDRTAWLTILSYLLLALFVYFVRRPYIKVSKTNLAKRGFIGERIIGAEQIKQIIIKPGHVLIEQGKQRWVYSRFLNRFEVDALAGKLKRFAEYNHVAFVDETTKG